MHHDQEEKKEKPLIWGKGQQTTACQWVEPHCHLCLCSPRTMNGFTFFSSWERVRGRILQPLNTVWNSPFNVHRYRFIETEIDLHAVYGCFCDGKMRPGLWYVSLGLYGKLPPLLRWSLGQCGLAGLTSRATAWSHRTFDFNCCAARPPQEKCSVLFSFKIVCYQLCASVH